MLALAGKRLGFDFPDFMWVEDTQIGDAADTELASRQAGDTCRIAGNFGDCPQQGLAGWVAAFIDPFANQRQQQFKSGRAWRRFAEGQQFFIIVDRRVV